MSKDLINEKQSTFYINNRGWRRIFRLAIMFGWEPMGTQKPADWESESEWEGMNYESNDGQIVRAEDAAHFADAIEEAIGMLEDEADEDGGSAFSGWEWEMEMVRRFRAAMLYGLKDPGFIFFDRSWEEKLTELVVFCREGAFAIF